MGGQGTLCGALDALALVCTGSRPSPRVARIHPQTRSRGLCLVRLASLRTSRNELSAPPRRTSLRPTTCSRGELQDCRTSGGARALLRPAVVLARPPLFLLAVRATPFVAAARAAHLDVVAPVESSPAFDRPLGFDVTGGDADGDGDERDDLTGERSALHRAMIAGTRAPVKDRHPRKRRPCFRRPLGG